jgi:hypothetical protein
MAWLIDHIWQTVLFTGVISALAWITRAQSAVLRLWLWRVAALKIVAPFSLLFALGAWLGFPVRHSAIALPASLVAAADAGLRVASPAQSFGLAGGTLTGAAVLMTGVLALCVGFLVTQLRQAREHQRQSLARLSVDVFAETPPLGFLRATLLSTVALVTLTAPMLAGAIKDRHWRQYVLAIDTRNLRAAKLSLSERAHRFGSRTEVLAQPGTVLIRDINLQDLVAMVYGIDNFEVFGGAMPWLEHPHYDVRVAGTLEAAGVFDPYSLRQPVTNYLHDEFGVSIRVNGRCQEPCLNQESFSVERLP